jgi:hypothetical protein
MPIIICYWCKNSSYKRPTRIARNKHNFCTQKCYAEWNKSIHPEGVCICINCNKEFRTNPAYIKRTPNNQRFCTVSCYIEFKKTARPSTNIDSCGYIPIRGVGGRQHRYIVEQKLGRKLLKTEHVHHINGIKTDNRVENLAVLPESLHHKIHGKNRLLPTPKEYLLWSID